MALAVAADPGFRAATCAWKALYDSVIRSVVVAHRDKLLHIKIPFKISHYFQ
jgi:hypothetical protein